MSFLYELRTKIDANVIRTWYYSPQEAHPDNKEYAIGTIMETTYVDQRVILAYPNVIEGQSPKRDENRLPFSGSINEIGRDIQRVKDMGVDHIIFGYNFLPIGRNVDKMINLSKELSKFAR